MSTNRIVMILGVQRSGTNALFDSLAKAPKVLACNESGDSEIYINFFLRPEPEIRKSLLNDKPVLLKPISETKKRSVQELLQEYSEYDFRILHIHRDPVNTYYSATLIWHVVLEEYLEEWNRRNRSIFEINPGWKDRVAFVKYEDMVEDPSVFYSAAQFAGIKGKYLFHDDSASGRKLLSTKVISKIDEETREIWNLLEQSRTFLPHPSRFNLPKTIARIRHRLR